MQRACNFKPKSLYCVCVRALSELQPTGGLLLLDWRPLVVALVCLNTEQYPTVLKAHGLTIHGLGLSSVCGSCNLGPKEALILMPYLVVIYRSECLVYTVIP